MGFETELRKRLVIKIYPEDYEMIVEEDGKEIMRGTVSKEFLDIVAKQYEPFLRETAEGNRDKIPVYRLGYGWVKKEDD